MAYKENKEVHIYLGGMDEAENKRFFGDRNYFILPKMEKYSFFSQFKGEERNLPTKISLSNISLVKFDTLLSVVRSYDERFIEQSDLDYIDKDDNVWDILDWYFRHDDCDPFYNIAKRLNKYGDKYFFLWLAQDKTMFQTTFFDTIHKRVFYQQNPKNIHTELLKRK